ncbi:MAG: MoaD/ThiS family protein [Chloroflexota bacterium]
MIRVKVQLFFSLRTAIGEREVELEIGDSQTRGVLDKLTERYGDRLEPPLIEPETNEPNRHYRLLVNGRDIKNLNDRRHGELRDGDTVQLFPPAAGG